MSVIAVWKISQFEQRPEQLQPVEFPTPPISLDQVSRQLPGGVYTTFRTYAGRQVIALEDQVRRLEHSSRLVGQSFSVPPQSLRRLLRTAWKAYPDGELRVRLTLDLEVEPGVLYLAVEPLRLPSPQEYSQGARAVICYYRRQNPEAKRTGFIAVAEELRGRLPSGVNEGLLAGEGGCLLEGLSSNFFVIKHGVVYTAGEGVLPGITRAHVLAAAQEEKIPVRLECVQASELAGLDEAFISSASRGVLPLRQIDATLIGAHQPGELTQVLSRAYWRRIEARLERM